MSEQKEDASAIAGLDQQVHDEDDIILSIVRDTAAETGERFFAALVKNLAEALGVAGAWVTEYLREARRLRALSFWCRDHYIDDYEYDVRRTPCEPVLENECLVHFPENLISLFPDDPDLGPLGAVSYLGMPLFDKDGTVMGHLAAIHDEPLPMRPRLEALFRIFAARAAAEMQRLKAESQVRAREQKLSAMMDSAMDGIIELDQHSNVTSVNPSALELFGCDAGEMIGRDFRTFLAAESSRKLGELARQLTERAAGRQFLWIPGGLTAISLERGEFPAEASLSRFEVRQESRYTLILRNIHDKLEAERKIQSLARESAYLKEEIDQTHNFREIVGKSRPMLELAASIKQVAPTGATVLIYGETGTGKELVARALHAASTRAQRPLIKVNCAAIPHELIESELFGHEKGAFTGATQKREGRFALADKGTIFLDEIGELPIDLQAKLLRVLQEGEFEPVGSSRTRKINTRVVAATNRDLQKATEEGRFREDLYYRLNVFPLRVPPLREREGDIPILADFFLSKFSHRMRRVVAPLSRECVRRLCVYDWPGNVRELENAMERAVIIAGDGHLSPGSLVPERAARGGSKAMPASRSGPETRIWTGVEMRQLEQENLARALESTGWRISGPGGAAELLGIPASTLNSRMKALGLKKPR